MDKKIEFCTGHFEGAQKRVFSEILILIAEIAHLMCRSFQAVFRTVLLKSTMKVLLLVAITVLYKCETCTIIGSTSLESVLS